MSQPSPRVAIVTGASRGIGAEIARRLAQDGCSVAINYSARLEAAQSVVDQIAAAGGRAVAIRADISRAAEVAELFDRTDAVLGPPTLVVSNAGIMTVSPIADMDDADFDAMLAINLKGAFNILREAARRLPSGARIINISTTQTRLASPGYGPYAASKVGVELLTQILAKELRGRGITVNAVAPGPTATDLFFEGKSPELIERIAKAAPLERLGTPEDIAGVVAMLASRDGNWINGQTVFANGGLV